MHTLIPSVLEFIRPSPWEVRTGTAAHVGITPRLGYYDNRFDLAGTSIRHRGRAALLCDGDEVLAIGWPDGERFEACFLVVPGCGWLFRSYSAARHVATALLLAVLALVGAKVGLPLIALAFALLAALVGSHAADWFRGERIARWLARTSRA